MLYYFYKFFIAYNLSSKYYQENEERLQRKACERYQNLSKEEEKKNDNTVVNVRKTLLSIEKNIIDLSNY